MNRKLLREALSANDQYVRTLAGTPTTTSTYAAEGVAAPVPGGARGILVNRTA
jgi:hypothetical protein